MPDTVIFDTNAYRKFASGDFAAVRAKAVALKQAETRLGNAALAHPIVIWELVAHLAIPTDEARKNCVKSIIALYEHTSEPSGGIRLIADSVLTLSKELFKSYPAAYGQGIQNLGSLVCHISQNPTRPDEAVAGENIANLHRWMQEKEQSWLDGMLSILDHLSPDAGRSLFGATTDSEAFERIKNYLHSEHFFVAWSAFVVVRHAAEIGLTLSGPKIEEKARIVREVFSVPFYLTRGLLLKLASPTPADLENPKKKRWNFVWDSMISFSIGEGELAGCPVLLVSADGEIAKAAADAGFGHAVITLDDYLARLGLVSP